MSEGVFFFKQGNPPNTEKAALKVRIGGQPRSSGSSSGSSSSRRYSSGVFLQSSCFLECIVKFTTVRIPDSR